MSWCSSQFQRPQRLHLSDGPSSNMRFDVVYARDCVVIPATNMTILPQLSNDISPCKRAFACTRPSVAIVTHVLSLCSTRPLSGTATTDTLPPWHTKIGPVSAPRWPGVPDYPAKHGTNPSIPPQHRQVRNMVDATTYKALLRRAGCPFPIYSHPDLTYPPPFVPHIHFSAPSLPCLPQI